MAEQVSPHHQEAAKALVKAVQDLGHDMDQVVDRARANLMGNPETGEVRHPYMTQIITLIEELVADTK
ncbi:hypothetical protein [Kerstersia similis]|uniref:hypothetical protein n=1 Tax=Kerstersia similis TaxID=206505 RepID=UPI0039EFAE4D